ncbi:MAG TPA: hypothetical protein VE338_15710, partial [Ktedonobacterales bacterium]|nr:hypothetical protein [Ktedonobacterales bacterium]
MPVQRLVTMRNGEGAALVDKGKPARTSYHWLARGILALGIALLLLWALIPTVRGVSLVANRSGRGAMPASHVVGIPVR